MVSYNTMEKLYRKVECSERLPEKTGEYNTDRGKAVYYTLGKYWVQFGASINPCCRMLIASLNRDLLIRVSTSLRIFLTLIIRSLVFSECERKASDINFYQFISDVFRK